MKREQVLLKPETIDKIQAKADEMSISRSAVIRQIVEAKFNESEWKFKGHSFDEVSKESHPLNKEFVKFMADDRFDKYKP